MSTTGPSGWNPAVRVYRTINQPITGSTITALSFDAERFEQGGGTIAPQHDPAVNPTRLTCYIDGIYVITGHIAWASAPNANNVQVAIRLNGTTYIARDVFALAQNVINGSLTTVAHLAVNDYVELCVYQNSGGAIDIIAAPMESPEFAMVRVG